MKAVNRKIIQLFGDLAFENPRPAERWHNRDDFDPPHGKTELNLAAKRGLIELDKSSENWRFRFSEKGRDAYEAGSSDHPEYGECHQ